MEGNSRVLIRGTVSEFAWKDGILREISGQWLSRLWFELGISSVQVKVLTV